MGENRFESPLAAMHDYYARGEEGERLASGIGLVEFLRTVEIVSRTLPDPPAVVGDIGGGPGRYTDWLVERGHRVIHRDVVGDHVDQVRARYGDAPPGPVDAALGDARQLDIDDGSLDAMLLCGPLYHLPARRDRLRALAEARRVLRPGGRLYAAAISRWAARIHGIVVSRAHLAFPATLALVDEAERTGFLPPAAEAGFTGYGHAPRELDDELTEAGFAVEAVVAVEGPLVAAGDLDARLADEDERAVLLDMARAVEAVPELLGMGPHLLAVAARPG